MALEIYDRIAKTTAKENNENREGLRKWLIKFGEETNRPYFVEWAKGLSREGLEMCLHIGFSEKALLESLSGVVLLEKVKLKKNDEKDDNR